MKIQHPNDLAIVVGRDPSQWSSTTTLLVKQIFDGFFRSPNPEYSSTCEVLANELTPKDVESLLAICRDFNLKGIDVSATTPSATALMSIAVNHAIWEMADYLQETFLDELDTQNWF